MYYKCFQQLRVFTHTLKMTCVRTATQELGVKQYDDNGVLSVIIASGKKKIRMGTIGSVGKRKDCQPMFSSECEQL